MFCVCVMRCVGPVPVEIRVTVRIFTPRTPLSHTKVIFKIIQLYLKKIEVYGLAPQYLLGSEEHDFPQQKPTLRHDTGNAKRDTRTATQTTRLMETARRDTAISTRQGLQTRHGM